ncbi:hypothetical protein K2P47_04125 [Patescibacteria group bacterium]|nr:hypothetical protein [Patescibacteria group bacterium]
MKHVLDLERPTRFWKIILFGHIDDVDEICKSLEAKLQAVWIGFSYDGDDDEVIATLNLKWVNALEVISINEFIIEKNSGVEIIHNGEVEENDSRDRVSIV